MGGGCASTPGVTCPMWEVPSKPSRRACPPGAVHGVVRGDVRDRAAVTQVLAARGAARRTPGRRSCEEARRVPRSRRSREAAETPKPRPRTGGREVGDASSPATSPGLSCALAVGHPRGPRAAARGRRRAPPGRRLRDEPGCGRLCSGPVSPVAAPVDARLGESCCIISTRALDHRATAAAASLQPAGARHPGRRTHLGVQRVRPAVPPRLRTPAQLRGWGLELERAEVSLVQRGLTAPHRPSGSRPVDHGTPPSSRRGRPSPSRLLRAHGARAVGVPAGFLTPMGASVAKPEGDTV